MTDCPKRDRLPHCRHQISPAVHYTVPHDKQLQCCFCGEIEIEHYKPLLTGGWEQVKHGPFYEPPRLLY